MPKTRHGAARHRKHKRVLKSAKGYWGTRSKVYTSAIETYMRGLKFATIHRRKRRREFRSLWITRISAACRNLGVTYSHFIRGLKQANIDLNRKVLADLAVRDSAGFKNLVSQAQAALT